MDDSGVIERIHLAPREGEPMERVESVEAVARRGLRGDRYFRDEGTFADREGSDVTFIEAETLAAVERDYDIELTAGSHRRNVTTRGVALNHLVGERFRVGEMQCEGIELCEPCSYLERQLEKAGIREALVHRGGLRATVLDGGTVAAGEEIRPD